MDGHETEEENLQKRYRSRNFTKYEKDVFYSVFNQYVGIIGDKNSSALTIREAWDKLVVEYNVQPNIYPRTRRQLQVLWRDEKFRAKKKEQKNKAQAWTGSSPLPVEAQLHSGSSSPSVKHKYDNVSSDEDDSYWSPNHHRRKARKNGNKIEMGSSMDRHAIANKREREIHQHRLQQLRQEGAMRMRVLEAELSLRQQQQHMEQQEHNLKMEILREKLKRLREGKPFAD
ncbi:uncharacterized protein LOC135202054 isoform X2 [Macrobrachium nipponense]|uniref:uncharacterized protein LOC135202054 isoform X2 n=1 Tax=Macrobrachium nipponense TaxID=159736 RepID=UPI0030C7DAE4